MQMRKFAATATLLVAALGFAAGTANAAPAAAPAPQGVHLNYVNQDGKVLLKTTDGSMDINNGVFEVKNAAGTVMAGVPLAVHVDDYQFPVAANISGDSATLTPQLDPAKAVYKPVALPFENSAPWKTPYDREQAAWNRMKDTISMAATLASAAGAVTGGLLGCGLGAVTAGVATAPLATLFGAGPVAGCLVGGVAVAAAFTVGANILITAPVAIAAAVQYFSTINAPFTPAPQPK